ncbi:DDE-type integrase/transposase/recombinase [Streptomyces sp. NBC_01455]|uniref:DDE-type integrase/transposase/recombinase n=1 Tax=Streptomyces sp. NBC_01455 TaxID=2903874 RepID=UPI003FCCCE4B
MNRCQFVDDHQRRFGVKRLCDILGIARSSFYYRRRTTVARAARQTVEAGLAARIRKVHQDSDGTCEAPRITAGLRDEGGGGSQRQAGRQDHADHRAPEGPSAPSAPHHRRGQAAPKSPDLIGRDYTPAAVNTKYISDITYLQVNSAKPLYLATVIDLASRRLARWAIADHMRADLVIDALAAAGRTRGSLAGAVMHTDHRSQGEFNWWSQHLDQGGVGWDDRGSRCRRRRPGRDGSGPRIGRCGRRCARPAARSRRALCDGSSGV